MKIGIIEDEVLIADNIAMHLEDMGHRIIGVAERYEEVLAQIEVERPDFFMVDIRLKGERSGLDVARDLRDRYAVPFLFLTSNTDKNMVSKAMETLPIAYIKKPFSQEDLFIAVELVKAKINLETKSNGRKVEIKDGTSTEWIPMSEILYLEADRSYVSIVTEKVTKVLRQNMGNLLDLFQDKEMVRIHRSFAVNLTKVDSISSTKVIMNGKKLPLGPKYKEDFLDWMRRHQTT